MREAREKENVLKYKLAYSGIILLVYIIGKNIPLYGIDLSAYRQMSFNAEELLVQTVSGDMYRSSVFAVGIFPSMISGLLVQLFLAVRNLFAKTRVPPGKINGLWEPKGTAFHGQLCTRVQVDLHAYTGMKVN